MEILRTQFHSRRAHSGRPLSDLESVELEEEWLEQNSEGAPVGLVGGRGDGTRRLDRVMDEVSEGTQADMLLGLVMGFVFGIIMLFWIWERGIPRRQKLGILCGIACNLTVVPLPGPCRCPDTSCCLSARLALAYGALAQRLGDARMQEGEGHCRQ